MGDTLYDYQTTEASSSTTGGVNTAEGQDPSTVNDGLRVHKQNVAKFLKDLGGTITTTGSANAHAATLNQPIATTVPTGFGFKIKWGYTNTSSTVNLNLNSIGNARVKVNYGGILADPIPGDIQAGAYGDIIFDGTYHVLLNPQQRAPYPSGHLYGLTLSNNSGTPTKFLDFAAGSCRDGADSANMDFPSAITAKDLETAWSVGSSGGLLATGAAVADGTYHIFAIKRPDTGVCDYAADTSVTGANIAANTNAAYTLKRRIGSILRSGGAIRAFRQDGDRFTLTSAVTERSSTSAAADAALTLTAVPTGIRTRPVLQIQMTATSGTIDAFTSLGDGDLAATDTIGAYIFAAASGFGATTLVILDRFRTNTSAQVRHKVTINSGSLGGNNILVTLGWIDTRGRT